MTDIDLIYIKKRHGAYYTVSVEEWERLSKEEKKELITEGRVEFVTDDGDSLDVVKALKLLRHMRGYAG